MLNKFQFKVLKNILVLILFSFFCCSFFSSKYHFKDLNFQNTNDSIKKDSITISNDSVFLLLHENTKSSYYGKKFEGKRTASGEIFDPNALTCAHKKLKFGTYLKVTNLRSKQSVLVRVNDRGPFIKSRSIDLSEKAFSILANGASAGIIRIKIEQFIKTVPKSDSKKDSISEFK